MANKGSALATGQFLVTGDYLVSSDGLFFAALQGDGNFCLYRGNGPGDNIYGGALWCTMSQQAGDCFAIMQGDGNFCVYHGTGPGANIGGALWGAMSQHGGPCFAAIQDDGNFCVYPGNPGAAVGHALWCAMRTDPVADVEIVSIDYDVQNARTLHSGAQELYRQTLTNNTGQAQNTSINGSTSIAETSG